MPDRSDGVLPGSVPVPELPGVQVRTWRVEDVPALAEAISTSAEHLRPFLPWVAQEPLTEVARAEMVIGWEVARMSGGDAVYGIIAAGRVLGGAGAHRRVAADGLEIGYWLRADEVGRGTMTRVVGALTRALLDQPGITHVEIRMDEANVRSAAIPPRCGYRLVERLERGREAPAETGRGLVWRIGEDPVPRD